MTKGYKIFQYYILAYTAKTVKEKNLSMKDPDPDPTNSLQAHHQHQDQDIQAQRDQGHRGGQI